MRVDKRQALPVAGPLAAGLTALGLAVAVNLMTPAPPGAVGYLGTRVHGEQLERAADLANALAAHAARKK